MISPPGFCTLDASQEANMGLEVLCEAAVVLQELTQPFMSLCWDSNISVP